jgi:hypothetical protein
MRNATHCLLAIVLVFGVLSARAAPLLITDNAGILIGAKGLVVSGVTYDVEFGDGSCFELYSGCNATEDFPFVIADIDIALEARQLLLTEVFVGEFDSAPDRTRGCMDPESCVVIFPILISESPFRVDSLVVYNDRLEARDNVLASLSSANGSTADRPTITYAVWSRSASVPAPPMLALGAVALAIFGLARTLGLRR